MPPTERSKPTADEDPDEDTPSADDQPKRSHRTAHGRSPRAPGRRRGVKAWDAPPGDGPGEEASQAPDEDAPAEKEHVYFRARDSVWFEPLVALMIIVVLLVSLYAYTSNWPPVYVVESQSMQHGYDDELGLINTGDLVLARQVPTSSIVPYVVGLQTGYTTYGEFGDVILYHPDGNTNEAPIIHRTLLYLQYNANGTYSAPDLHGLLCGNGGNIVFSANSSGAHKGCSTIGMRGTLTLFGIGWQSVPVQIPLDPTYLGTHDGFVTMGDNNFDGGLGATDQAGLLSKLVQPGWVIGVARGMIPWFGALKLAIDGNDTEVPAQSWQYMGITLVGLFLAALGLHLFLRAEGVEDERRKRAEAESAPEEEASPKKPRGRFRWRVWERDEGEEEPEDVPPKGGKRPPSPSEDDPEP
ncbi:MAG TPA: S26 family signal peptidase, partial [Thermoplasmata archaeon]|nr:S26 family signal peptidase [Thermoplasmata archaeon]